MTRMKRQLLCIVPALLSLYAVSSMLKIQASHYPVSNSVFSIALFVGLYALMRAAYPRLNKRLAVVSGISGFFFSAFMIAGASVVQSGYTYLNRPQTWARILFGVPLFMALTALLLTTLPQWNAAARVPTIEAFCSRRSTCKKVFFVSWLLVFLAWLPGLIASYPGVYGYDSVYQIQYYLSGNISLHHPLAHTYLLGFCVVTLGNLLGSAEAGLLVYSVFQMLCLSAAFAAVCWYMARRGLAAPIRWAFLLLFMFLPVNALLSFSATKDVLFAAIFALLLLLLLHMAEDPAVLKKKTFCLLFILTAFLFLIFRNQSIYVFLCGMLCAFIFMRGQWKRLLGLSVVCIVLFGVYSGPITTLCGGVKSNSTKEMLSVPVMQLSRMMLYAPDKLSEEEKTLIEAYIPAYASYSFNMAISDRMKNSLDTARIEANPGEFFGLWARLGLRCPSVYVDAFARLTVGYWYPDVNYRDAHAAHPYWEYNNTKQNEEGSWYIVVRKTPRGMGWLANFYADLTYRNLYQKIPLLSMLFSSGFMMWIVFLYVAWWVYNKRYTHAVPAGFLLALWLTLLLGPVVLYRYIYPIALAVPLLICQAMTDKGASPVE